jgi:hypothetical protein
MGANWTIVSALPGAAGADLLAYGTNLIAGVVNAGVHLSTNGGTTWIDIRDGLPPVAIAFFYLAIQGSDLFCGTDAAGVWQRPISEITSVQPMDPLAPKELVLSQNFPNPFNPKTEIRFQVPRGGFVSLQVYDLLGREVATIVNEKLAAGTYTRTFDAIALASGTYIYRLRAGDHVVTKKLVLLR